MARLAVPEHDGVRVACVHHRNRRAVPCSPGDKIWHGVVRCGQPLDIGGLECPTFIHLTKSVLQGDWLSAL